MAPPLAMLKTTYIAFFLTFLVSGSMLAQPNKTGVPIVTNYDYSITGGSEQNYCITQDLRGVVYVGNNDKGVLEYDGVEWRTIQVPNDPEVRSIVTGENGVVYVGAESEFGYLSPDERGNLHYISLSDTINQDRNPFSGVWNTYFVNGKVYFCTFARIYEYDPLLDSLGFIDLTPYAYYAYFIDTTLFLSDYGEGLMQFSFDRFVPVKGGHFFKEMVISGILKYDETRLLISTYLNGLFLYNLAAGEVEGSFVDPGLDEFFKNEQILNLHSLDEEFAVATRLKGLVILDRNGEAKEIITKKESLIDETIPGIYSDGLHQKSGPVWIANWRGVSKLEIHNPFRVFREESGFEGFITDIAEFNGTLFISTTSGLFFKRSSSTSTGFEPVPGIKEDIRQLHIFNPRRGVQLLLATSDSKISVIDERMGVTDLKDHVINLPGDQGSSTDYAGEELVLDPKQPDVIYTGINEIVGLQYTRSGWREIGRVKNLPQEEKLQMEIDKYGYLWTSTPRRIMRLDISLKNAATIKSLLMENGLPASEKNRVFLDPMTLEVLLGTLDGFYRYNYFRDTVYRDTLYNRILPPGKNLIHAFHEDQDGDYWISFENEYTGWTEIAARRTGDWVEAIRGKSFQRLPRVSTDVFYGDNAQGVWFGKSNELYHFDKSFFRNDSVAFISLIRNVTIKNNEILFNGTNFRENGRGGYLIQNYQDETTQPHIKYRNNDIAFSWAAPYFEEEEETRFSYMLEGFDEDWSAWNRASYKDFTNLRYGPYTMHVKAMNVYGVESIPATYSFTIYRPWYATYGAILGYLILSGLLVFLLVKLYTRRLKLENIRLEGIIEERTAEIRKQKEELTDSIEYASRIQRALLPPRKLMDEQGLEHFILFRPRDIVSGDFYWMGMKNGRLLIVAADCTGHGVPGAFMSMLGMTFLDEIVIKAEITSTDEILEQLRQHVITSLRQSGKSIEESTKDGMDLAMVSIDLKSREIQFSGAYNPLYIVRKLKPSEIKRLEEQEELDIPRGSIHDDKNLLMQIRADQMPIGISEKKSPFTATTFKDEGFSMYMFSDGFLDQFGGPQGKKFMSKNFKKMILELQSVPMHEQGAALEKVLQGWMGEISQIDDILVMGLRMNEL